VVVQVAYQFVQPLRKIGVRRGFHHDVPFDRSVAKKDGNARAYGSQRRQRAAGVEQAI